jgi:hypothetical protein
VLLDQVWAAVNGGPAPEAVGSRQLGAALSAAEAKELEALEQLNHTLDLALNVLKQQTLKDDSLEIMLYYMDVCMRSTRKYIEDLEISRVDDPEAPAVIRH